MRKVNVLMDDQQFERFDSFCSERGYKKSSLIVRLLRDYLDAEGFYVQPHLDLTGVKESKPTGRRQ